MFSRTSWEFLDFSTTTLLSLTAVCILRTLDWLLHGRQGEEAVRVSATQQGCDLLILADTFTQTHTKTYRFSHSLGKREEDINDPDAVISNPLD